MYIRKRRNPYARVMFLLCILFAVAAVTFIALGIRNLYRIDQSIEQGYEDVETRILDAIKDRIKQTSDPNEVAESGPVDTISTSGEPIDKQIDPELSTVKELVITEFLLTFQLDKNYKTAVFNGVTEENLKKGSARLEGSSFPGQKGNCIIYGHRDSSFKAMKYLNVGDTIEVLTVDGILTYTVDDIFITTPTDPMINQRSEGQILTLVTCYPFVLSGPANERCVAIASKN